MGGKIDTIFFADTLSSQTLQAKSVVLTCNHMADISTVTPSAWKPNTDRHSLSRSLSDLCWIRTRVQFLAEKTCIADHQHMLCLGCWSPAGVLVFPPGFLTNVPSKTSFDNTPAKFSVTVIFYLAGRGSTSLMVLEQHSYFRGSEWLGLHCAHSALNCSNYNPLYISLHQMKQASRIAVENHAFLF